MLGPNGAGKTTLMRIIFGVLDADAGVVRWRGAPATATDRRRWGYMPQERGLYREMRTLDHLVWLARLYGIDRAEARVRATDLLDRLGLADRQRDPIRELSGGMAQRVQLAAAMVHGPDLLVLDEPFAGLDPGAIEFLTDVIHDHVAAGGTLVFSSHQLDLVENLCESIVMLHDGRVVLERRSPGSQANEHHQVPPRRRRRSRRPGSSRHLLGSPPPTRPAPGWRSTHAPTRAPCSIRSEQHAAVDDFGVESPTLSELFLAATRSST